MVERASNLCKSECLGGLPDSFPIALSVSEHEVTQN